MTRPTTSEPDRRGLLRLLALSASAWGLSAPLLNPAFAQSASSSKAPELLRIGYQKSAANLVMLKQQGALEKRFPATKVVWVEFPAGPQLLEALAVGSLEFGLTGDAPPVFAQAAGKDLVYVGAEPPKPDSSAILVLRDSPLKTLAELKGKKVALQKGSSAHYLLVRAVEKAGLQWSDITPIYLTPADARAAFERKSVDAWAIWDPFYSASLPLATQHPETIAALFEELTKANRFAQENRPQAIKLIADFSGLDAGVVSLFLQRRPPSPVAPLSASTRADQQRVADGFFKLGLIPKAVQVADIVWAAPAVRLASAKP